MKLDESDKILLASRLLRIKSIQYVDCYEHIVLQYNYCYLIISVGVFLKRCLSAMIIGHKYTKIV